MYTITEQYINLWYMKKGRFCTIEVGDDRDVRGEGQNNSRGNGLKFETSV